MTIILLKRVCTIYRYLPVADSVDVNGYRNSITDDEYRLRYLVMGRDEKDRGLELAAINAKRKTRPTSLNCALRYA